MGNWQALSSPVSLRLRAIPLFMACWFDASILGMIGTAMGHHYNFELVLWPGLELHSPECKAIMLTTTPTVPKSYKCNISCKSYIDTLQKHHYSLCWQCIDKPRPKIEYGEPIMPWPCLAGMHQSIMWFCRILFVAVLSMQLHGLLDKFGKPINEDTVPTSY